MNTGNHRRNLGNKARRDLARSLRPLRFDHFQTAQTKLHDHFYHDILNERDFQYHIASGRLYAQQLIQIALERQSHHT